MKTKLKQLFTSHEYRNAYILVGLIVVGSYYGIREFITDQSAWAIVKVAPLTVNMLLLYFLWGVYIERKMKKHSQYKRLAVDFAGFMVITLVFRFGFNMKSILG